jgi:transcription initiation factor IIF auxiliary subunit
MLFRANYIGQTAIKNPPFRIQEEGWGEFDMQIGLYADKEHTINHDLNFQQTRYESKHTIVR